MTFHPLANSADIEEGKGQPFKLDGHRIALVRHKDEIYAIDDLCPHADASMAFGPVENGCIACPWHFAEFRLETGEVLSGPATRDVRSYRVREVEGKVEVCVDLNRQGEPWKSSSEDETST